LARTSNQLKIDCPIDDVVTIGVMSSQNSQYSIITCLPNEGNFSDFDEFTQELVATSLVTDENWGGFHESEYLEDALREKIHEGDNNKYTQPSDSNIKACRQLIVDALENCQNTLPFPAKDFPQIFLYPWFPDDENQAVFHGTMGTCFYATFFHVYVDFRDYSKDSLKETVAHEYNHAVFKQTQNGNGSLLDVMIMEGLAEHFQEQVCNGEPSPWAQAIERSQLVNKIKSIEDHLRKTAEYGELYAKIFYGKGEYSRWLGYSIGYWIIDSYIASKENIDWAKLMQLSSAEILENAGFANLIQNS
jgi:uncharacterized protein YjaZ